MNVTCPKLRIAVITFAYEADREIARDMIASVIRSCRGVEIEFFINDDASPSNVGAELVMFCADHGVHAVALRDETNLGFRGAVYRTIKLLDAVSRQARSYDVVLRIDTDALVIRDGLGEALGAMCVDPRGIYGVLQYMRRKDRFGFLLDLMPIGLKRDHRGSQIEQSFSFSRFAPVWWARLGWLALWRGFRFGFVEGSCYVLGGQVPGILRDKGFFSAFDAQKHGLITSEEDVIVTVMCHAAGLKVHQIDHADGTWREVNRIGPEVLAQPEGRVPYVYHALKPNPEHHQLRADIKNALPFFAKQS